MTTFRVFKTTVFALVWICGSVCNLLRFLFSSVSFHTEENPSERKISTTGENILSADWLNESEAGTEDPVLDWWFFQWEKNDCVTWSSGTKPAVILCLINQINIWSSCWTQWENIVKTQNYRTLHRRRAAYTRLSLVQTCSGRFAVGQDRGLITFSPVHVGPD